MLTKWAIEQVARLASLFSIQVTVTETANHNIERPDQRMRSLLQESRSRPPFPVAEMSDMHYSAGS